MIKPNSVKSLVLSLLVLMTLCLLPSVTSAQRLPAEPIKGAEVKLARYGGAQFGGSGGMSSFRLEVIASTTADENGNFTFPVLPAGKYVVIVERPKATENTSSARMESGTVKFFNVRLKLPGGKKIEKDYDPDQKKAFEPAKTDPAAQSASRTGGQTSSAEREYLPRLVDFIFESDGKTPCEGAVVKSKSNITNN